MIPMREKINLFKTYSKMFNKHKRLYGKVIFGRCVSYFSNYAKNIKNGSL